MSKFGARSTALEVVRGHDLTGFNAIITGGSSGIGVETARALAQAGANVTLAVRDIPKTEPVAKDLRESTGNNNIEIEALDLTSLASVRDFVKRYLAKNRPLNILINNAGVMATPQSKTADGFEMQFGTNHIGHFVLSVGLLPALREGFKQSGKKSRVVSVSSIAHARAGVQFDDVNWEKTPYNPWLAYGQSKTANILFAVEFTKRYQNEGVVSNSLHPGGIFTGLQKFVDRETQIQMKWIDENGTPNDMFKTIEQGASTSVWAAVADELENVGGKYLEDCRISVLKASPADIFTDYTGHVEYAVNPENAA